MIPVTDAIAIAEGEIEFTFMTASGPGGQNVNRVATAAQLRFDAARSPALPDDVRRRLAGLAGKRMTGDGVIVIKAQRYRSQERNRDDALARLTALIRRAAERPTTRRATRPSPAATERRLAEKTRRGQTKRRRGPIDPED